MIGRGSFGGCERNRDNRDDDSEGNYVIVLALAVYCTVVVRGPYLCHKVFVNIFGVTTLEKNCSVLMIIFVALCSLPRIAEIGKRRVFYTCTLCI